jgi:hypothetical protein
MITNIFSHIQWKALLQNPKWFFTMHFPYIVKGLIQSIYIPRHKNIIYNSRVWDGMTRNDFIKGELIRFLGKIQITKKPQKWEDDPNLAYWLGSIEDD